MIPTPMEKEERRCTLAFVRHLPASPMKRCRLSDCTRKGTGMRVRRGKLLKWHEWLHTNTKP